MQGAGAVLNGLLIGYNTDAQSTLRNGILVNTLGNVPIPQTSIESVSVAPTGSTIQSGNINATSGIKVIEGQVAARNTLVIGGDIGYELRNLQTDPNSGGCILFGTEVYALDIGQYGVFTTQDVGASNVTALRISNGVFTGSNTAPPLGPGTRTGSLVESGFLCSLRACAYLFWDVGVSVQPQSVDPANQANIQIDDSTFVLMDLCVSFGSGTINSSVSDTDFGSAISQVPLPVTVKKGVLVEASSLGDVRGISIASNTIHVSDYDNSGADTYAVRVRSAADVFIEGNDMIHDEVSGAASQNAAVLIRNSRDIVVADNKIRSTSNIAAVLVAARAERLAFANNVIECPESWTPYGIALGSVNGGGPASVTVTGNVIDLQSANLPGAAALLIAGDRCTATGNRILPSAQGTGPAIYVDSDENAIGSNSCSLPVPPLVAAIYLSANADNNTVVANVCRTVPPVDDTAGGTGNEVAHNI